MQGLAALLIYLIVFIELFLTAAKAGKTGAASAGKGEVVRVVIVSRHGVHAPAVQRFVDFSQEFPHSRLYTGRLILNGLIKTLKGGQA